MGARRVLIVDDEEGFTRLVKLALEDAGDYEVRIENDPRKAVQAARWFDPHAIVLDILMPEMSGFEVARKIREDAKLAKRPVLFLSAAVSRETPRVDGEQLQDCAVLVKPIGSDDLAAAIDKALAG